jgi:Clp amino terminal domain, pathogenicity island component
MFERYTEKARRLIFFARYEASQFGSPYIETEHLLLGLLRESRTITSKLLKPDSVFQIRKKIESHSGQRKTIPTSVDLPLSNESKRVLAFAAEEAERLSHKYIGSEHLLLGLLRESGGLAAGLLNEEGLTLQRARDEIASWPPEAELKSLGGERTVEVRGRKFSYDYILRVANAALKFVWIGREWKPVDIVVDNEQGGICFDVSVADGKRFQIQPGGWTREPCAICDWELQADGGPERSEGFTNGRRWICAECYHRFVERKGGGPSSWDST